MHFRADIIMGQPVEIVSTFFDDPQTLAKWDRSVVRVVPLSLGPPSAGFRFDTIAPNGMRMSYRITEHDRRHGTTIRLVSSNVFRRAIWRISYRTAPTGTQVMCELDFSLRASCLFLAVPLAVVGRKALLRDLKALKDALEQFDDAIVSGAPPIEKG